MLIHASEYKSLLLYLLACTPSLTPFHIVSLAFPFPFPFPFSILIPFAQTPFTASAGMLHVISHDNFNPPHFFFLLSCLPLIDHAPTSFVMCRIASACFFLLTFQISTSSDQMNIFSCSGRQSRARQGHAAGQDETGQGMIMNHDCIPHAAHCILHMDCPFVICHCCCLRLRRAIFVFHFISSFFFPTRYLRL